MQTNYLVQYTEIGCNCTHIHLSIFFLSSEAKTPESPKQNFLFLVCSTIFNIPQWCTEKVNYFISVGACEFHAMWASVNRVQNVLEKTR